MIPYDPIVNEILESVKADVVESIKSNNRVASGSTIDNITIEDSGDNKNIMAPEYIDALEYGRKPTSTNATAGDPTLFERIEQWISDKGLDLNPYAVTKSIHKNGYPGKPGVITAPLGDPLEQHVDDMCDKIGDQVVQDILAGF